MWKQIQCVLISIILFNVNTGYSTVLVSHLKKFGICSESKWMKLSDGDGNLICAYLGQRKSEISKPINLVNDIKFFLYTRDNVNDSYQLIVDDVVNLKESPFDSTVLTKIIIHGWGDSEDGNLVQRFKNDYLSIGNYNIINIEWSKLSSKISSYYSAVHNTIPTAEYCAKLVRHLVNCGNLQPADLHIIGFSLGSHVAGLIGKKYGRYQIGRITALDAALPLYAQASADVRVYRGDAIFVDAIHGDGGGLGFMSPFADMDFYANGGKSPQPGCTLGAPGCSHTKVPEYYLQTITQPFLYPSQECANLHALEARKCYSDPESTAYMGAAATYISCSSGIFYCSTET